MNFLESYRKSQNVFKLHISGVITGQSLEKVIRDLSKRPYTKPVALSVVVNSPGGNAAHSSLIYHRIKSFASHHKIPVYTFAEDLAASGGYYLMCSGETLYASTPLTLVGSIGAMTSFISVKDFVSKFGIERRTWASSDLDIHKRLDPFSNISEETKAWVKNMLEETNSEFRKIVLENRQAKIKVESPKINEILFNGDVFYAEKAIELGLIDSVGRCDDVIKEKFGNAEVIELSKENKFEKIVRKLTS